jgi:hypothetical protein
VDSVIDWLNTHPRNHRVTVLTILIGAALALVTSAFLLRAAAPLLGALAGATLFLTTYGTWATLLPDHTRTRLDLKGKYPLRQRRGYLAGATAAWVVLVLLAGPYLPAPVVGTLNVFVLVSLYWLWRATPTEAAHARAATEAAQRESQTHSEDDPATGEGPDPATGENPTPTP